MASKSRKWFQQVLYFLRYLFILILQLYLFLIIFFRVVPVPISPLMILRGTEINKTWMPLSKISPEVPKAAMTSEDPRFIQHYGFDLGAIRESVEDNLEKGKKLRGGSTISQQTAKNFLLWPKRSWFRKGLEVPITLTLELFWTKRRIMEVYLNIIEMGDGIYGIEAASRKYFKKSSSQLTASEAALIVVCFPNPRRWTPNKPTSYIRKKQARILKWMKGFDPIPDYWNLSPAKN